MKENQKTGLFASPEIDIPVSMLLSNVLRSIGGSLAAEKSKTDEMRKRMLLAEIEAHPGPLSLLSKEVIQRTPAEYSEEYLSQIMEAVSLRQPVALLGPHWSVVDAANFLRLAFELEEKFKIIGADRKIPVTGVASSKFFDYRMIAAAVVPALSRLGLNLHQVIQLQDDALRSSLSVFHILRSNHGAWHQVANDMEVGDLLGVFPEGTRSREVGSQRPHRLNCKVITKALPDHTLLVPMLTRNSFEFLNFEMKKPNYKKWPEFYIGQPILMSDAKILATYLSSLHADQAEYHPLEVVFPLALYQENEELWGEHSDHIHSFVQLLAEHGSLNGILDHLKQGLVESETTEGSKNL
ncbi:hypothetical protein KC921_03885 [Candidatus Woesebacteria bacterium]|nr:hypothetical protein [Candidatus Woesebacteria bacterium]